MVADRLERNSSSQLAVISAHVGRVEYVFKASPTEGTSVPDPELASPNNEFTVHKHFLYQMFSDCHSVFTL